MTPFMMSLIETIALGISITCFVLGTTAIIACMFRDSRAHDVGAVRIEGMDQDEINELIDGVE